MFLILVERNYVCQVCKKGFISARHLKIHTFKHSKKQGDHQLKTDCPKKCDNIKMDKSIEENGNDQFINEPSVENQKEFGAIEDVKTHLDSREKFVIFSWMWKIYWFVSCYFRTTELPNANSICNKHFKSKTQGSKELCTYCGKQFR